MVSRGGGGPIGRGPAAPTQPAALSAGDRVNCLWLERREIGPRTQSLRL